MQRIKKETTELNFFDRFLYKLVIGLILLVLVMGAGKLKILSVQKLQNKLNEQLNILKVVKIFNTPNKTLLPINDTDEAITVINLQYPDFSLYNGGRRILLNDDQVKNVVSGVVVKITKGDTMTITIKGSDGCDYIYENITKSHVNIYQYVNVNQKIATAANNTFDLFVMRKGSIIDLDDVTLV